MKILMTIAMKNNLKNSINKTKITMKAIQDKKFAMTTMETK